MKSLRIFCLVAFVGALAASCSRDPIAQRDAHFQKGETYFKQGKLKEAGVEFKTALKFDAKMGAAYFKLGEIAQKQEDSRTALEAFVRAADLMPTDIEAQIHAANY